MAFVPTTPEYQDDTALPADETLFLCNQCSAVFNTEINLNQHLKTHEQNKDGHCFKRDDLENSDSTNYDQSRCTKDFIESSHYLQEHAHIPKIMYSESNEPTHNQLILNNTKPFACNVFFTLAYIFPSGGPSLAEKKNQT